MYYPINILKLMFKQEKSEFDWWSKYYYSTGKLEKVQKGYSDPHTRLKLYDKELEKSYEK